MSLPFLLSYMSLCVTCVHKTSKLHFASLSNMLTVLHSTTHSLKILKANLYLESLPKKRERKIMLESYSPLHKFASLIPPSTIFYSTPPPPAPLSLDKIFTNLLKHFSLQPNFQLLNKDLHERKHKKTSPYRSQ